MKPPETRMVPVEQAGQGAVELFLVIALVTLTLLVGFTFYRERLAPQPTSAVVEKVEAPVEEEVVPAEDTSSTEEEAPSEAEESTESP